MKTRIIYKEKRIADLEHWITSGHHLSAGTNDLVLEFRGKTKWRLQLNTTADLRAVTVYLWKIVNVEGFGLFDKHIPFNLSTNRRSQSYQTGHHMKVISPSSTLTNSNKNPFETISDMYKNSVNHQTNQHRTTTDPLQNNRAKMLSGTGLYSSYMYSSDHAQPLCFSADLEDLKYLFDFPEEVAMRLTEIEHEIFLSVPPLQYLRHYHNDNKQATYQRS